MENIMRLPCTWGCCVWKHPHVLHWNIPMFYIGTSGCSGNRSLIWGLHDVGLMVVGKHIEYLVKVIMIHSLNEGHFLYFFY